MKDNLETLLITGEHIQTIISNVGLDVIMDELIEKTYKAFVNFDADESIMPIRAGFNYLEPHEGLVEWMPIRTISKEEVLVKMVAYHPRNPVKYHLPTIISTISKYDTRNGHLKALIDGVLPTSLRTGAVAAVASKLFGNTNSVSLGLIGCGAQSITQLHALSRVFKFKQIYFYDADEMTQKSFIERVSMLNLSCDFIPSNIKEIVEESDIVSTATSIGIGDGPLFQNQKTKGWLHINAIGSDFEGKFELPIDFLGQSYVCPDRLSQAKIEGECQQLQDDQIGDDLSSCLKQANQLEHLKNQRTVFDSTGIALQDSVVADLFLKYAEKMGLGERVSLESASMEEKTPYSFMIKYEEK